MPTLPWMPRFDYDASSTWSASIPTRQWRPTILMTGGSDRAATWVGASYEVSRAYCLRVTLRYLESEEDDVFDLIDYLRSWPNTGTFYPDQSDLGTSFTVDIQTPAKGEPLEGVEDQTFPQGREIEILLRNTAGVAFAITWY